MGDRAAKRIGDQDEGGASDALRPPAKHT